MNRNLREDTACKSEKKYPVKSQNRIWKKERDKKLNQFKISCAINQNEESIVGLSLEIVELKGKEEMQRKCHLERKCGKLADIFSISILR